MSYFWIIFIISIIIFSVWEIRKPKIQKRIHEKKYGKELDDPFAAEVLFKGEVVAFLSERRTSEMFWREYRIESKTVEALEIIENNDLWDECVFDFRDPKTGRVCTSGFVGGTKPFIRNGKISLRALYFGSVDKRDDAKLMRK